MAFNPDIPAAQLYPDLWMRMESKLKNITPSGKCCNGEREKIIAEFQMAVAERELARRRAGK